MCSAALVACKPSTASCAPSTHQSASRQSSALGIGAAVAGPAPGRRPDVHGLHHGGDGSDREPGREAEVHVRRKDHASSDDHDQRLAPDFRPLRNTARASKPCSAHVPGLKVVMPSNAHDAKGLLVASIRDDNPVIYAKQKTPVRREGSRAQKNCSKCHSVSPTSLAPAVRCHDRDLWPHGRRVTQSSLDPVERRRRRRSYRPAHPATDGLASRSSHSVKRTNHCVVVHEAVRFAGLWAPRSQSQIQEEAFDYLDAPIGRIGCTVLTGSVLAGALEGAYVPDAKRIADGVRAAVARLSTSA